MDTADGIAAGKEKFYEAMKDSRVGSFGVISLLIIYLIQISALLKLGDMAFLAYPICSFFGRISPLFALEYFPFIEIEGIQSMHKLNWKGLKQELIISNLIIIIIIINIILIETDLNTKFIYIILFFACLFIAFFNSIILGNKIKGFSGDSLGALVVNTETSIMIFLAVFSPVF
tara:strand:- start:40160 stop:40681 length:522 start_codon:yes stop_codon:yes gene_type:complete